VKESSEPLVLLCSLEYPGLGYPPPGCSNKVGGPAPASATHCANPRAARFGVHPGIPAKQWQTNPGDLDAEMITRLPVQLSIIGNLFTTSTASYAACTARTLLLAGSVGDSPRPGPDHTVEDDPGAGLMITVTKYLVSRTLTKVD
jgi:hypothetical protein